MGRSARGEKVGPVHGSAHKPERPVRGPRAGTTTGEASPLPGITDYRAAFSRRVQWALLARAMRRAEAGDETKLTGGGFAALVSDVLRPDKPLLPETVRKWSAGETTPDPVAVMAMARVLEVDPGWLTYGIHSGAPAPYDAGTTRDADEALGNGHRPLGASVAAKTVRLVAPRTPAKAVKKAAKAAKPNGHQHKRR